LHFYVIHGNFIMKLSLQSLLSGVAIAVATLTAAPSYAVQYLGSSFAAASALNSVDSFGSGSAQSFDVNFGVFTRATLDFLTFRDEATSTMSFNALVNNFTGFNFEGLTVTLTGGAVFTMPNGTVTAAFSPSSTSLTATKVSTLFSAGEGYAVNFGNPLSNNGESDWMIDFSAVQSGGTFGMTVAAVPEPETYAMLLAGLALMGTLARRRQQK
jgi:hypothetical protein